MSSVKRKMPSTGQGLLQRRVRPRVEPEPESEVDERDSDAPSEEDPGSAGSGSSDEEAASGSDEDSDAESEKIGGRRNKKSAADEVAQLTFGALARAQASLGGSGKKKRRGSGSSAATADADAGKVGRYNYLGDIETKEAREAREERVRKKEVLKRANKHAPVEMTSKKPVSRKRDFIDVPKVQARDPRFDTLGTTFGQAAPIDEGKLRRAYSFLDDYQDDEMKQLRDAIKKTKDVGEKEKLTQALMSMESKKKARVRKDKERELLEEHRKQEKELVAQGKQPFYLKKSEQKKRLLVDQFAHMKKGQVDKAIERKRKKVAGKEKKSLPWARRTVGDGE